VSVFDFLGAKIGKRGRKSKDCAFFALFTPIYIYARARKPPFPLPIFRFKAPPRQNMYMFFEKDVHVFAKRCTCFRKNIYIFWPNAPLKKFFSGAFEKKRSVFEKKISTFAVAADALIRGRLTGYEK